MFFNAIPQLFPPAGWAWSAKTLSINIPATCSSTFGRIKLNPLIRNCSSKNLSMCVSPSLFSLLFKHVLNFSTHLQVLLEAARLYFAGWVFEILPYPVSVIFNSYLSIIAISTCIPLLKSLLQKTAAWYKILEKSRLSLSTSAASFSVQTGMSKNNRTLLPSGRIFNAFSPKLSAW